MFSYIKTTNPSGKAARICMSADYTHIGTAINVKNFVLPLVDHERKMISESLRDDRLRRFGHSIRQPIPNDVRVHTITYLGGQCSGILFSGNVEETP